MEKLYDIAKNEYTTEDDDGKNRLVYAYFEQCLEETLSIMIWTDKIYTKKVKSNKEINEIIDAIENSKKTMGNLINEIKHIYSLTNSIVEQLGKILEIRNYLIHKYFKLNIAKFYSEIGKLEMIEYFCNFIDDSKKLEEQLKFYYKNYTDKLGLTEEKIEFILNSLKL